MSTWRLIFPILFGFIISFLSQAVALAAACDPKFEDKLCVAEHAYARACKPLPDSYQHFRIEEQLYDLFQLSPEMVQLGFCNVDKVRVLKRWHDRDIAAYVQSNQMYISRSKLFELADPNLEDSHLWDQYKWPIHHRGATFFFLDRAALKKVLHWPEENPFESSYQLAYIFLHELAHVIDLEPNFYLGRSGGNFNCFAAHQQLNQRSYQTRKSPFKGYGWLFPDQFGEGLDSDLCLELMQSPYGSFYGVIDQYEDFAELFADYVLLEHFGINYTIEKNGEVLFDRAKQFENENIQNKLAIVKKVLEWPQMTDVERQGFMDDRTHCRGIFEPTLVQ